MKPWSLLWVALGGAFGSLGRYAVYLAADRWCPRAWVPMGTLTVNTVGCLAIGALAAWIAHRDSFSESWRLFLVVGVLGGFTTFSTFGQDFVVLARREELGRALSHLGANIALGLGAVWLGAWLVQKLGAE
ncbi:MAG: fluoride efflux transporter CrcB [Planctomycetes bacterium]|nr:fluoride efflux transporter CrcB [Planctomycetota bacterium]